MLNLHERANFARMLLELCAYSVSACRDAHRHGVARIELCAGRAEGGLTPSMGLLTLARQQAMIDRSLTFIDKVLADIRARDLRDTGRSTAPLVMAADANLLDTSFLSIESAVQRAVQLVEARLKAHANPGG